MRLLFSGTSLSFILLVSVFLTVFFLPGESFCQITLTGSGLSGNPKLCFRNIEGSEKEVNTKVFNTLWACGWFDLVSGIKSAEYIIDGKMENGNIVLSVKNGGEVEICKVRTKGTAPNAIYSAVDLILNKLFNIQGICQSRIAFSAETGRGKKEIYMCDIDGSNIKKITSNGSLNIEASWHPSGKALLFNQYLTASTPLVEYDIVRNRSRILSGMRGLNSGKVSHNGKKIALVVTLGNQVDLFVRDYEGGNIVRLTNDRANEASPCWSPDDSKICFVSDKTGRPKLYIISAEGGKAERLKGTSGSECVAPAWNKNNLIAYTAKLGSYVLKVMDLNKIFPMTGTEENSVRPYISENLSIQGEGASWAPDNRHIVLAVNGKILVADTRTGKSRILVHGKSSCTGAAWSPVLR